MYEPGDRDAVLLGSSIEGFPTGKGKKWARTTDETTMMTTIRMQVLDFSCSSRS